MLYSVLGDQMPGHQSAQRSSTTGDQHRPRVPPPADVFYGRSSTDPCQTRAPHHIPTHRQLRLTTRHQPAHHTSIKTHTTITLIRNNI
ncbi:hypothetical protein, partial [Streptomyces endocoffeicus]|uniref:hypothetical protein n=1 Tax=Streptomyces endocoffeicus TaxID=2898945 RepID=UPI001E2E6B2B